MQNFIPYSLAELKFQRKHIWVPILLVVLISLLLWNLTYHTSRSEFSSFIGQYLAAFALFYVLWLNKAGLNFTVFLLLAIGFRLILLPSYPVLSDDYFRFIWDGELMTRGINPYAHIPNDLISHSGIMMDDYLRKIYHGMSTLSQENYTCYPVVNQLFFAFPASVTESASSFLLVLKSIMVLADIGVIIIGKKILEKLEFNTHYIWLYGLNPFIILEFTGNLHFEGIMIFFLLLAIWLLLMNKWILSSTFLGIAIQVKLIPLLLIPFVFKKLGWRRSLGYVSMVGIIVLVIGKLLFTPMLFAHFTESLNNYYTNFEFNAGLFTIVKELGFMINGWDPVNTAGPVMRNLALAGILALALLRKYRYDQDIFKGMLFGLVIYYSFATTVHPWYISMILILSVFTQYKFGLIWSMLVMLSYYAYSSIGFSESPLFLWTEYLGVYLVLFYEIRKYTKSDNFGMQLKEFFGREEKELNE